MFRLFGEKKKTQMQILKDLQGNPYKFYRGKDCDFSKGCFFCSCFDIAKSYRLFDDSAIIETEIQVRNPLVIDATEEGGHSKYGYLRVRDCRLYPEDKRNELIELIKKEGGTDTLSTDQVLKWAIGTKEIDAVIVKNVREGINEDLPMYDIMVWSEENLVKQRNVVNEEYEFETFRANTFKRVDLSAFISENEQDGMVNITEGVGYFVEHMIKRDGTNWYMGHELVVNTDIPIEIYCLDTGKYVTAEELEHGVYSNTAYMTSRKPFVPCNGIVRVKGLLPNCKYRIE